MENDYHEMMGLKSRAEAADVAKSQVHVKTSDIQSVLSPLYSFQYFTTLSRETMFVKFAEVLHFAVSGNSFP